MLTKSEAKGKREEISKDKEKERVEYLPIPERVTWVGLVLLRKTEGVFRRGR